MCVSDVNPLLDLLATLFTFQFHLVEKYELTADEYSKRQDTVQSYLKRNKMGKYNEEEMKKLEEKKMQELQEDKEMVANFKVGDRCEVDVPGAGGKRRGTVKFIGII